VCSALTSFDLSIKNNGLTRPLVVSVALLLVIGAFASVASPSIAQTPCTSCAPVGFGNSNYDFYPYQGTGSSYPTARFDTTVNIQTSMSADGYFTGATEGCSADDLWTYQNNFFDPSGQFIQEVLAVGLTQNTPSCFTIEWGPPGTTQVYNYEATMIPPTYTPDFENAGNSLDFAMQGAVGQLPNGEVNITSFNLLLNGAQVAILTPSQMLNYSTGQLLNGADGPVFYDAMTGQNFNVVGPGDGQTIVFSSGAGTITYCGSVPNNPPELGGLVGFVSGGATTVESSNLFYGIPSATSSSCSYGPATYSQYFNILPINSSSSTTTTTTTTTTTGNGVCNQGSSSSGVSIDSPTCNTTTAGPALNVQGTDSLLPGNYAVGAPNQALGFPCSNGNTANPPGCPPEPQLNILSSWADNYNPAAGTFRVHLNMSDLSGLSVVSPPAQGQFWSVQWTYSGTSYFAQMDEWLTNVENVTAAGITGPMQVSGISFWYGTVSLTEINSGTPAGGLLYTSYNYVGQLSGDYSQTAPGEITMTVPVSGVGNPVAGAIFSNFLATTGQVEGVANYSSPYSGLQVVSSPDTVYATNSYKLGAPLLPDGYVQVSLLPSSESPGSSTTWSTATLSNYPDTNNWQASISLSSLSAGTYAIYARQFVNYTGIAGPTTATQFKYSPTVSMTLSPSSANVQPGRQITTSASIKGGVQTVYITVGTLPKGVSVSFSENPVTNSFTGVTSLITFYTAHNTPKTTYHITITAIGTDGLSSTASFALTV
jgi:hypothetical protein